MKTSQAIFMFDEMKRRIVRKNNMTRHKMEHSASLRNIVALKVQPPDELPSAKSDFGMKASTPSRPYIFSSAIFAYDTIVRELYIE